MANSEIPLDCEDWQVTFRIYDGHPQLAIILAQHFCKLKEYLRSEPANIPEAVAAVDRAVASLYRHTKFEKLGRDRFGLTIVGRLTREQEQLIDDLGAGLIPSAEGSGD